MPGVKKRGKPIVIWGARGQALVLADMLPYRGYRIVAFFDNDPAVESPVHGVPIHHGQRGLTHWLAGAARRGSVSFAVAIGGDRGRDRLKIQSLLIASGLRPATLVHPSSIVARTATLGEGCQVLAGSVIGPGAVLGAAVIVNTSASVDHECALADGTHIGPGAVLAGCVKVGTCAFVGAGAVVVPRISIGHDACVGAGAVVIDDVVARAVVVGNPASPLRRTRRRPTSSR